MARAAATATGLAAAVRRRAGLALGLVVAVPRRAVVALGLVVALTTGARADTRLDRLVSHDPAVVRAAVAELAAAPTIADPAGAAPTTPPPPPPAGAPGASVDELYAAARASEDVLHEPARALAFYDRILRDAPSARLAVAAHRRAEELHAVVGEAATYATEAAALAAARADAETADPAALERTLADLAARAWPGAPDAALFHVDWLRRHGRFAAAIAAADAVAARWPTSPAARVARRTAAGAALDAHDWTAALARATALPAADPLDALERDDLLAHARRGRLFDRLYVAAYLALAAALAALAASLALARRAAPPPKRPLRLPGELVFLAPIGGVLVAVAFTAHRLVAPAVLVIVLGALAIATLSGLALDQAPRPTRARVVVHAAVAVVAAVALLYIAVARDHLLDMLLETVRFGPDAS